MSAKAPRSYYIAIKRSLEINPRTPALQTKGSFVSLQKEKLKDLIHEIAYATSGLSGFGRTKLYKVLWFFEARQFVTTGAKFSGAKYIRDRHGPRLHNFDKWFRELEQEGRIECFDEPYYNRTVKRVRARVPPKGGLLSADQSRDLQFWIKSVNASTAEEISEASHDYGWEIIEQGDDIPLHAILAERVRPPIGEELEWAKRKARELNLP